MGGKRNKIIRSQHKTFDTYVRTICKNATKKLTAILTLLRGGL